MTARLHPNARVLLGAIAAGVTALLVVALLFVNPADAKDTRRAPSATTTSTATTTSAPVDLARLTITVTTTSPLAKVHLAPATARFASVRDNSANVTALKISDGISITNVPSTGATVRFEVLAEDLTNATSFRATLEQATAGKSTATIVNHSTSPFTVATLKSGPATSVATSLSRAKLFGTIEPELAHADSRHLVLAFYYGWYGLSSFGTGRMFDQPAMGPYSASDPTAVYSMTKQARDNGIDGFVMSWSGDTSTGSKFDLALQSARATNGYATGYLETLVANATRDSSQPADPTVVKAWLDQLLARSSDPAFLTSDGIPVVFVYGMYRLPVSVWASILDNEAAAGHPVRLVGDGSLPAYASVMWGSHMYNPNQLSYDQLSSWNHGRLVAERGPASVDPAVAPKLYAATVSPGFDNRIAKALDGQTGTFVPRGTNGERYQLTWDAALHNDPDWVLVTTWNEWYEGTAVQPGVTTGTLALTQTKANSANF